MNAVNLTDRVREITRTPSSTTPRRRPFVKVLRCTTVATVFAGVSGFLLWSGKSWLDDRNDHVIARHGMVHSEITEIGSSTEGIVVQLPVSAGQSIRKGDLIAMLDDRIEKARVETCRARLVQAKKKVLAAKAALEQEHRSLAARIKLAESQVAVSNSELERSRQRLPYLEKEIKRSQALVKRSAISRTDFETIECDHRQHQSLIQIHRGRSQTAADELSLVQTELASRETRELEIEVLQANWRDG